MPRVTVKRAGWVGVREEKKRVAVATTFFLLGVERDVVLPLPAVPVLDGADAVVQRVLRCNNRHLQIVEEEERKIRWQNYTQIR